MTGCWACCWLKVASFLGAILYDISRGIGMHWSMVQWNMRLAVAQPVSLPADGSKSSCLFRSIVGFGFSHRNSRAPAHKTKDLGSELRLHIRHERANERFFFCLLALAAVTAVFWFFGLKRGMSNDKCEGTATARGYKKHVI